MKEYSKKTFLFKVEVLIRQLLSHVIGVMLGRYRLGKGGFHIAHPNPSEGELAPCEVPTPPLDQSHRACPRLDLGALRPSKSTTPCPSWAGIACLATTPCIACATFLRLI